MNDGAIVFLPIAILLAYGVGCLGKKRKIGFWWAFGLSFINLFLGLIVTLLSGKKDIDFVDVRKEDK